MRFGLADFPLRRRTRAREGFAASGRLFGRANRSVAALSAAAILVAFAALAAPAPADSQQIIYAQGQGSPNSLGLPVNVTASVGGRCGFQDAGGAPNGNVDTPNFDVTGINGSVPFRLNCTGASRVAVASLNGGLLNGGATGPGYTGLAPYNVKLTLVPNAGASVVATCPVATLKTGAVAVCAPTDFRGTASATTGLRLGAPSTTPTSTIEILAPAYAGAATLIAGNYSDTLTVTVSPST
ncbi:MAG: hypothetical protein ACJ8EB_12265 [Allosphingosinicella sp.]